MKRLSIAALASLTLAGCHHDTPLVASASQEAAAAAAALTGLSLTKYEAVGGGRYWHFKLTNNGSGFSIEYSLSSGMPTIVETGTITSQTDLSGGDWLIEGMAGSKPITVLIERRGPLQCNDGYYSARDDVRVVWSGELHKGCGPYIQ